MRIGDQHGNERGDQGEFIRHGEETPQELQEGVRGGDGDLVSQNALEGGGHGGDLFLVRPDEQQIHIPQRKGGNGLERLGGRRDGLRLRERQVEIGHGDLRGVGGVY